MILFHRIFNTHSFLLTLAVLLPIVFMQCGDNSYKSHDSVDMERQELYSTIESKSDSLDSITEMLRARANVSGENVNPMYRVQLNELLEEKYRLQLQLQKLSDVDEENWQEIKKEIEHELLRIENDFKQKHESVEYEIDDEY